MYQKEARTQTQLLHFERHNKWSAELEEGNYQLFKDIGISKVNELKLRCNAHYRVLDRPVRGRQVQKVHRDDVISSTEPESNRVAG